MSKSIEKCPSNECEIRDTCTGHAWCTGERKRAPAPADVPPIDRCINCGDMFDENAEKAARREPYGSWRPCPNPRPGSQEFKDCGVGRHLYQPQVECDIDEIMLDGCVCPCGCGERGCRVLELGQHVTNMVADGVADAIMELEAWAEWWIANDAPYPSATGKLADAALKEEFSRRWIRSVAIGISWNDPGTNIPWQAIYHLEAAAILRDGWRPT